MARVIRKQREADRRAAKEEKKRARREPKQQVTAPFVPRPEAKIITRRIMDTTPVTPGVLEGLDRFLALNPRPETQAEIVALKRYYGARASHEARLRSAKEEFQAAEAALLAHGYPHEPSAIVDEEILLDMDVRLENLKAARAKFREARDAETA